MVTLIRCTSYIQRQTHTPPLKPAALCSSTENRSTSLATGAGDNPGEYLIVVDSESTECPASQGHPYLRPEGETELTLPFMNSQGIQVAALSAHFNAGDVVHRNAGTLPEPVRLDLGQLVFYDLFLSPANTVIEYGIIFPPQSEEMAEALPPVQLIWQRRQSNRNWQG